MLIASSWLAGSCGDMFGNSNGCIIYQAAWLIVMTNLHKRTYINQLEHVTSYAYLGSLVTEDGQSEKETKRSLMIARSTFTNLMTLLLCSGKILQQTAIPTLGFSAISDAAKPQQEITKIKNKTKI